MEELPGSFRIGPDARRIDGTRFPATLSIRTSHTFIIVRGRPRVKSAIASETTGRPLGQAENTVALEFAGHSKFERPIVG